MANRSRGRAGSIEGINVTPLVDITLVLLTVFMVTAKLVMAPAIPLDLPSASQAEEVQAILSIALAEDGALFADGAPVTAERLSSEARALVTRDPEARAVIQADRHASHGQVMAVLDLLKAEGLARIAFGALESDEVKERAAVLEDARGE